MWYVSSTPHYICHKYLTFVVVYVALLSVPDTPYAVRRQHWLRFNSLDSIVTRFQTFGKVPQEEIDEYAAHRASAAIRTQNRGNALNGDDRCSADGDLLTSTARKLFVRLERADESGSVCEQS